VVAYPILFTPEQGVTRFYIQVIEAPFIVINGFDTLAVRTDFSVFYAAEVKKTRVSLKPAPENSSNYYEQHTDAALQHSTSLSCSAAQPLQITPLTGRSPVRATRT